MNARLLAAVVVLLLMGLIALMALQWKLGSEGFAVTSPQQVVVPLGGRKIVGGGRAGVQFDRRLGKRAEMRVRCAGGEHFVKIQTGKTSDEICQVRLHLHSFSSETGTLATSQANLEVTWEAPDTPATEEPAT